MPDTFLIPLDGTPIAEAGLLWAERAARKSGAMLHLLTVKERDTSDPGLSEAIDYLDGHVQRLRALGLRADFTVKLGEFAPGILQETTYADMTVLTSGTTRWIISPVLDKVLQNMECPIVLIRGDSPDWQPASNVDRILLPLSEFDYSSSSMPLVQRLAKTFGSEIILLHNVTPVDAPGSPDESPFVAVATKRTEVDLSQAEEYVERMAAQVRAHGINVRTVVSTGKPAQQIVAVGREYGAGLIAMATRGRNRLESRIAGSVANVVLESTPIPCLLIRAASPHATPSSNGHVTSTVLANAVTDASA